MWLPSLIQQHYSLLLGHGGSLGGGSCPLSNLPFPFCGQLHGFWRALGERVQGAPAQGFS